MKLKHRIGMWMFFWGRRLTCKHFYMRTRTIHGDEINHRNGVRSEWRCCMCDKYAESKYLDKPPGTK